MGSKRKRKRPNNTVDSNEKRQKISGTRRRRPNPKDSVIKQALLAQFYPQVFTLREYLLSKLPTPSKIRRKKILSVGVCGTSGAIENEELAAYLDRTLVGVSRGGEGIPGDRWRHWNTFSQKADESMSTLINLNAVGRYSQSEIVDFAIWLLFSKNAGAGHGGRVHHLLCQGYQKHASSHMVNRDENFTSAIPGIVSTYPNGHVTSMKTAPWPQILLLVGTEGERAMVDLILDCGVFVEVGDGRGIYHQLCGLPLSELQVLSESERKPPGPPLTVSKNRGVIKVVEHNASSIKFVRSRVMYARAAFNAQGGVRFGLRHIHVLNRYAVRAQLDEVSNRDLSMGRRTDPNTIHVMMYLFPRQFELHNVFTSEVDSRQTVQPYKDYTLREDEINQRYATRGPIKVPKRLRAAVELVCKLQIQHGRCAYKSLLEYYCPVTCAFPVFPLAPTQVKDGQDVSAEFETQCSGDVSREFGGSSAAQEVQERKPVSMMSHATPPTMVSAFCCSVLSTLIPKDFWGTGDVERHNHKVFLRNVDRFIQLRRFENLSLHEVAQNMKIPSIEWLRPPNCHIKSSQSDHKKRLEIFHEFIYYVFDSLLIPLLRANFHVTESNVHRYRLFYFRHDIWQTLSKPTIASLKISMFEEIKLENARELLDARKLGFSQVRLLPKETGVRPIMNLRRRALKKGSKNLLGTSINSVLAPVYNAFSYEKAAHPQCLGSAMFSVGELYSRLKTFKSKLTNPSEILYFVKVDVKSAFDTIPQALVVQLMSSLTTESEYRISKHAEIKPGDNYREDLLGKTNSKPMRKWAALAKSADDYETFDENLVNELAIGRRNVIFVENIVDQFRDTAQLMSLLTEHVQRNMVKIGKKFYRQKEGIPQGSVLSSLLCNYFYADLEARHLGFLNKKETLLLRLIDDFLLVTTDHSHAKQFLQIMHDGVPEYGVQVNPTKSLINFEATINNQKVARLLGSHDFPYCGSYINTKTLNISRDRDRRKDFAIVDSLTVEFSKTPGRSFHRKVLNAFKIQAHAMFLDTAFNSLPTVTSNVHSAFIETATKMWTYAKCLPVGKQPGTKLLCKTITDLIDLAFVLMKSKGKNKKNIGYKCALSKLQVKWLAINAFKTVLQKRQSKYTQTLQWLETHLSAITGKEKRICKRMRGVVGQM